MASNNTKLLHYSYGGQKFEMGRQGHVSPEGSESLLLPLLASGGCMNSLPRGAKSCQSLLSYQNCFFLSGLLSPFCKDSCGYIGHSEIIQDNLPISRSLI